MKPQHSLAASPVPRFPNLQVAKVIGFHRDSTSVDVMLLNSGITLEDVPFLGTEGTWAGVTLPMAPTVAREALAKKTYHSPDLNAARPLANTWKDRDLYVVVGQVETSQRGVAGVVAFGFLPNTISELHFDGHKFPDLFLYRHPSDFQITIDRYATFSLQHPSGFARFILENVIPKKDEGGTPDMGDQAITMDDTTVEAADPGVVDLAYQDRDQYYTLRENTLTFMVATDRRPQIYYSVPRIHKGHPGFEDFMGIVIDGKEFDPAWPPTGSSFVLDTSSAFAKFHGTAYLDGEGVLIAVGGLTWMVRYTELSPIRLGIVIDPPLDGPPGLGTIVYRENMDHADFPPRIIGDVSHWLTMAGDAKLRAYWEQYGPVSKRGEPHGKIIDYSGEYHAETVKKGDIDETTEKGDNHRTATGYIREKATKDITEDSDEDIKETAQNIKEVATKDITSKAGGDRTEQAGKGISEKAGKDIAMTAGKDVSAKAGKDISLTAGKSITGTAATSITLSSGTKIEISALGEVSITSLASVLITSLADVSITAVGAVTIDAAEILLNGESEPDVE